MTCRYESDEGICINPDCPMCADYCPIPDDIPDVCKWEDRNTKENNAK